MTAARRFRQCRTGQQTASAATSTDFWLRGVQGSMLLSREKADRLRAYEQRFIVSRTVTSLCGSLALRSPRFSLGVWHVCEVLVGRWIAEVGAFTRGICHVFCPPTLWQCRAMIAFAFGVV